jgi:hypothetical protein
MFLYECIDCGAMDVEYKCPHEVCTEEQLTDPDSGATYTRYTCIGCGYTYSSEPTEVPAEEPVICNHQWGIDQVRDDGLALYRCEVCDAVYEAYIETEPTEPETEATEPETEATEPQTESTENE